MKILRGLYMRTLYRVVRRGRSAIEAALQQYAGRGRYDVGGDLRPVPSDESSDVVYVGFTEEAALAEGFDSLKQKKPQDNSNSSEAKTDDLESPSVDSFTMSHADFAGLELVEVILAEEGRFADVAHPESLSELNRSEEVVRAFKDAYLAKGKTVPTLETQVRPTPEAQTAMGQLATTADAEQIETIDLSAITGKKTFTQAVGLYVYQLKDAKGEPIYKGIVYPSKIGLPLRCLAVFPSRIKLVEGARRDIDPEDPAVRKVMSWLNIELAHDTGPGSAA